MLRKYLSFGLPILLVALFFNLSPLQVISSPLSAVQTLPPVAPTLKTNFMLGLSNSPGNVNWMTGSGVAWDARYQYLSGGANTSYGWSTWNSPPGAFAGYYMQDSASKGYLPVFSYYNLLYSTPASGSNEGDKNFNNLNNTGTMNSYFANFKLLMDQARQFGKPVIVHVEPDLWGYLQHKSSNPNAVSASVASSGYADLAAYPNSVAGFARALVHLRDAYAPNVLLAYHVSPWASSFGDLSSSHDSNFNVQGAAQETANFFLQMTANFDLLFYDISDRDAAFYSIVYSDPNHWWDTNNTTFPNFNRFNQFALSITNLTGKRGMLWQVPIGNTLYRSVNNTYRHYQDNRVQYYLNDSSHQHLRDLANAGIIGLLFGAGDGNTTSYDDGNGDGVTNPAPINGNNLVSQYSDDDGGNLRLTSKSFYQSGGLPLHPAIPVNLNFAAVGPNQLTLNWQRGSTDETGFSIERKTGAAGAWSEVGTTGAGITSFASQSLTNGTPYYFRLRAYNGLGYSNYSVEAAATTSLPAPANLNITALQSTSLTLSWTNQANNSPAFRVEKKEGPNGSWATIVSLNPGTLTYNLTNLPNGTPIFLRVLAYNVYATSAYSAEATASTPFPAPDNLSGQPVSSTQARLNWSDHSNTETSFRVERSTGNPGTFAEIGSTATSATNFLDTGGQSDTLYYYRVRAANPYTTTLYSNQISLTLPPAEPSNLQVTAITNTEVSLAWTNNSNTATGFYLDSKTGPNGSWQPAIATIPAATTIFTDTGLITGTLHSYRLHSYNANGQSAASNEVSAFSTGDLVVKKGLDDGTIYTLSWAISQTISGPYRSISFAPGLSVITITTGITLPDLPAGVSVGGGCNQNGPAISLVWQGNTGKVWNVAGNSLLYGLRMRGLRVQQSTPSSGTNKLVCVVSSRT